MSKGGPGSNEHYVDPVIVEIGMSKGGPRSGENQLVDKHEYFLQGHERKYYSTPVY